MGSNPLSQVKASRRRDSLGRIIEAHGAFLTQQRRRRRLSRRRRQPESTQFLGFHVHGALADARYLHEKFSVLKAPGAPTAALETLVSDKRVANAPVSSQPATPTPAPSSPVPLPPGDIPLGSPRPAVPPPTKRASLFSNERLKGTLSWGGTQPPPSAPAPAPAPVQVPAQEKQGGYKQIAVPDGQADAGTDCVPQGHGEDHGPPTPAKDDSTRNGRMTAPEPASESTRVAAA
jgi:vacuolar protein sorting-associated protein 54